MAGAKVGRRSLMQLFKQACNEIPEVVGSCTAGLLGIVICFSALHYYNKHELWNRRFKLMPTVVRPEDERAKNIRTD